MLKMKGKHLEDSIIWNSILVLERSVLVITSAGCMLLLCIGVFLRYFLNMSMFGYVEILTLFACYLYFVGSVNGSYEGSQITADITDRIIYSEKKRRIVRIIRMAVTVIITGVFSYWVIVDFLSWSLAQGGATSGLRIPKLAYNMSMIIGIIMMFLYSVYHFIRLIKPKGDKN